MSQFKALIYKNWILYKRGWIGAILQLLIPIAIVLLVLNIKSFIILNHYPETQYVDANFSGFRYSHQYPAELTNTTFPPQIKNCTTNTVNGNYERNGIVALAPSSDPLINQLNLTLVELGYETKGFDSDVEIDSYVRDKLYGIDDLHKSICFGVSVDSSSQNYKFNLRFNVTVGSLSEGPQTTLKATIDEPIYLGAITQPLQSGMLEINNLMLNAIIRKEIGTNYSMNPIISPMKQQAYQSNQVCIYLCYSIQLFCVLPLLLVYLRQTSQMLRQKQSKIRQTMKIMGMKNSIYYLTWFIRYFLVYLVISIANSIILKIAFPNVNYIIIFLEYILFCILLIIQSFFIQTFFTRAKTGLIAALLFYMIQYVIIYKSSTSNNPTIQQNKYVSISSYAAFALALQEIVYSNSVSLNLDFTNINQNINNYSILISYLSYIFNIIFWGILSLYLEQVLPNEFGAKKDPLFPFKYFLDKFKKQNQKIKKSSLLQESVENVEEIQIKFKEMEKQNQIINIKNLTKVYDNGKQAINGLNLKIYNDQIFALLGHNGAGKTSTISILTGLLTPTSGTIEVLGLDIKKDIQQLRKSMGICPQHDTLFNELTVQEHIYLFGTFKGYSSQQLDQEVTKLIKDVNLQEKRKYLCKNLSGGQKRRLSVALSFVGGSKLIFLDQPTSGMDTSARRYIWNMMKNYKSNRIIILTTHFMDEADFLGDRIGIMGDGRLLCAGSSIFLKNKFGVGYNITIVKKQKSKSQKIIQLVESIIPNSMVSTNVSSQITMQLGMNRIDNFPKLFSQLDQRKNELGIQTYGVSITTLQEVFLKVTSLLHIQQNKLVNKKINQNKEKDENIKKVQMPPLQQKLLSLSNSIESQKQSNNKSPDSMFLRHIKSTLIKRTRILKKDYKGFAIQFFLPMIIIAAGLGLMKIQFANDYPNQTINLQLFQSQGFPLSMPISGNGSSIFITQLSNQINLDNLNKLNTIITNSTDAISFDSKVVFPMKNPKLKAGIFILPVVNNRFKFYALVNTKSPTTPFLIPTLVTQSYINSLVSRPITIQIINSPLPLTYHQSSAGIIISSIIGINIFAIALAFKFSSIISFIVKENTQKCKHQQIVSGLNIYSYWIANFIFDFSTYLILAIFSAGMCKAFSIQGFNQGQAYLSVWLLLILNGLAGIPFIYLLSFLFNNYGTAQISSYFFYYAFSGILTQVIFVLKILSNSTKITGEYLPYLLNLIPAYGFGQGLLNLANLTELSFSYNDGELLNVFSLKITLLPIIYLVFQSFFYFMLIFVIQNLHKKQSFNRFFSKQKSVKYQQKQYQKDVAQQMLKAQNADPQDYAVVTKDLRKVFMLDKNNHKIAVDKLSFTVDKGEIFGLLGINGAGKTTTFKILCGQLTSTSGDAYINGLKISQNLKAIRQDLGYCPQFDALLQNLTVKEQLQLYFDMKGLCQQSMNQIIQDLINKIGLKQYTNTISGTLSGGNKRKLSLACAILGDPSVIFLDEPSTGMDPQSRRFMWKIISKIATQKKNSTVILTTHSMEQAQALSSRLGIMINGNFSCLGSPQYIKTKYGDGYEIQLKVELPTKQEITQRLSQANLQNEQFIKLKIFEEALDKICPSAEIKEQLTITGHGKHIVKQLMENKQISSEYLIEFILIGEAGNKIRKSLNEEFNKIEIMQHFQKYYRYKLSSDVPLGKIFGYFEKNKKQLRIEQYSIKQATVEQIFNRFAEQNEIQNN